MFYKDDKRKNPAQAKPLKDLTRVVSKESILGDEKRAELLKRIQAGCLLEGARFEALCMGLVQELTNYYQSLPETLNTYFSQTFGLIDHSLSRTEAAISLFQQYVILDATGEASEEQKLWQYALVTASLIQGIGKLYVDFFIELFDNNGQFVKNWNPLAETLASAGAYYTYHYQKESDKEFRRRLNLLLAQTIMPTLGFAWIASDKEVLASWLALINEDFYAAGTLGAVLERADAIALQKYYLQHLQRLNAQSAAKYGGAGTFAGGSADILDLEQKTGIEFIEWLKQSLANGKLAINKGSLLLTSEGLLLSEETFKEFVNNNPDYKSWQAVKNGFLSLGLHQIGAEGNVISRFEQNNNRQMYSGVVFVNYSVGLPPELHLHNLVTGKTIPTTAVEISYQSQFNTFFTRQQRAVAEAALESLNKAGHWQKTQIILSPKPTQEPSPVPTPPGSNPRG